MSLENNNLLSDKKDKTILYLLGINKRWVRSTNNEWVEFSEEVIKSPQPENNQTEIVEAETLSKRKWWQFWKKKV